MATNGQNPLDHWDAVEPARDVIPQWAEAEDDRAGSSHDPLEGPIRRQPTTQSTRTQQRNGSHQPGPDSEQDDFPRARNLFPRGSTATGNLGVHREEISAPKPLRRELEAIHIFMIAISTVIGVGYYIRTGIILRIGGPAAVVYSYVFLGVLTLMVTRNLAVMLRIWPVAGALTVFVENFVDKEVGTAVAIMYWLSFSFSFAGLTTAIGDLVDYLDAGDAGTIIVTILSLVVPIILNLTDIRVFRWIEFVFGFVKLTLALCIIIIMNVMNPDVGANTTPDADTIAPREVIFHSSNDEYGGWFASISASVFLASFSILGIEIVAATAQEANFETTPPRTRRRPTLEDGNNEMMSIGVGRRSSMTSLEHHHPHHPHHYHHNPTTRGSTSSISSLPHYDPNEDPPIFTGSTANATKTTIVNRKDPFAYAMWIPTTVTVVYVWGGWIVSQNIRWDDERLPTLEWGAAVPKGASISPFINSAADSGFSKHLPKTLTSLLVLHVISTSSSVLYVAARTLFGFAYTTSNRLAGQRRTWRYRVASWLAAKNKFDVPYVAVLVSAWLFWLPFLKYTSRRSFNSAVNVITEMASVACVLVWALESLAAFNFYRCYKKFHLSVRQDIKSVAKVDDTSWYYSHLIISMLSVILCLGIVFIGGTMTLLLNLDPLQGVAAFSIIFVFFFLTLALKFDKGGRKALLSWGTRLSVSDNVTDIFISLDDQKKHNLERQERARMTVWDLGGVVNSEWIGKHLNWRR